jgi:hypothetical protein
MRKLVEDTLKELEPEIKYSQNAVELILGTGAQESAYGKYVRQIGGGPALGKFQMEPETFNDICDNFLKYRPKIKAKIFDICGITDLNPVDLVNNDRLAVCMCRVHYLRPKGAIPDNLLGWAEYWKKNYNTIKGKGTVEEFVYNYKFYVLEQSLL